VSVVIVGVIRRKPVLTHASIVCEGMLASVNSVKILLLNKFLPVVDKCLSCEDIARQSCTTFCILYLQRAPTFQTCILNSH